MLAFGLGYDNYQKILKGAHDMDLNAASDDPMKNMPLLLALLGVSSCVCVCVWSVSVSVSMCLRLSLVYLSLSLCL